MSNQCSILGSLVDPSMFLKSWKRLGLGKEKSSGMGASRLRRRPSYAGFKMEWPRLIGSLRESLQRIEDGGGFNENRT